MWITSGYSEGSVTRTCPHQRASSILMAEPGMGWKWQTRCHKNKVPFGGGIYTHFPVELGLVYSWVYHVNSYCKATSLSMPLPFFRIKQSKMELEQALSWHLSMPWLTLKRFILQDWPSRTPWYRGSFLRIIFSLPEISRGWKWTNRA
jgi:hypothetical protein